MTISLRIILIAASLFTCGYMLKRIRQAKIRIDHSIFWMLLSGVFILFSIFPVIPTWLSHVLGFQAPVNFIFLFIIFVLLLKLFFNSLVISSLEDKVTALTQKIALEERRKEEEKKETDV